MKSWLATFFAAAILHGLIAHEYPVKRLDAYPRERAALWKAPVYRCTDPKISTALYCFFDFAPGTAKIRVKLNSRFTEKTKVSCMMSFKQMQGKDTGRSPNKVLTASNHFNISELSFDVPRNSVRAQFVISIKGDPAEFEIKSLEWTTSFDRDFNVKHLDTYPRTRAPFWKAPVYRCSDPKISTALYCFFDFAPGTTGICLKLTYRATETTSSSCSLTYKTAQNKGAGKSSVVKLIPSKTFRTEVMNFDVPQNASRAQFVMGISGNPAELEIRSLTWDITTDQAFLNKKTVVGKPSLWQNAVNLRNFRIASGGGSAAVQTTVRLAYDDKNLYAGFIADEPNMQNIKANITKRDGELWNDDCVELFLFDRNYNSGWHFILNPRGTQYDGAIRQRVEGDPYREYAWNGKWSSETWKNNDSWEAAFTIPWSSLGYKKIPDELYMNFARERTGNREVSQWNAFVGGLHTVPKYARVSFGPKAEITRYRKAETESYLPKRAKTAGKELFSSEDGHYIAGEWHLCCYPSNYPADLRKSFTPEKQRAYLEDIARHGMFAPELPWAAMKRNIPGGLEELKRLNKDFGMKYPYAVFGSAIETQAIKKYHAPLYSGKHYVDFASEEYLKAALDTIAGLKKFMSDPGNRSLVLFAHGVDEPTNYLPAIYNVKSNPELKKALADYDSKVKTEAGFGKYGYYDWSETPDEGTPFRKLAMFQYWNTRFANYLKVTAKAIREIDPNLPYLAVNANTCSGVSELDYAMASPHSSFFGCDPYPTSARNFFGMARAVYHTGFSVRMVHDLANRSRVCVMPQAFIYHSGRPKPADMREWASQALKNGAELFFWFTAGPAIITMPDGYAEMLKLNKEITSMKQLPLPKETKSAILYSNADRVALDDKASHAAYTVYSILGEHVKANFRFVSPTGLKSGIHTLNGISVLYIPRMSYTDPASTKILLDFVKKGGTMVVFDPEIWRFNTCGSTVPERELICGKLVKRNAVSTPLTYNKKELPVTAVSHLARNSGKITAYDFSENAGKTIAVYPDGKPAAVEKNLGKGKILFFAVLPFGNSDTAITPEGWKDFFSALCKTHGERIGLPIWDFVLPGK